MLMDKKETRLLVENWRNLINENSIVNRSSVADLNFEQLNNQILNDEQVENLSEKVKKIYDFINLESKDENSFTCLNNLLIKKPASETGLDSSRFKFPKGHSSLLKRQLGVNLSLENANKETNTIKEILGKITGKIGEITDKIGEITDKIDHNDLAPIIAAAGVGATIGTMLMGICVYSDYKVDKLKDAAIKAFKDDKVANKIGLSHQSEARMKSYIDNLYLSIDAKMQSKGSNEDYSAVKNEIRIMLVKGAIFNEILLKNGLSNLEEDELKEIVNTKFNKFNLDDESNAKYKTGLVDYLVALKKIDSAIYYSNFK